MHFSLMFLSSKVFSTNYGDSLFWNYLTCSLWNCTNFKEKAVDVAKMLLYPNFVIVLNQWIVLTSLYTDLVCSSMQIWRCIGIVGIFWLLGVLLMSIICLSTHFPTWFDVCIARLGDQIGLNCAVEFCLSVYFAVSFLSWCAPDINFYQNVFSDIIFDVCKTELGNHIGFKLCCKALSFELFPSLIFCYHLFMTSSQVLFHLECSWS